MEQLENQYIGGQFLDRGITIRNLIGFYYGRNPQKFQQDTVLQHAHMYGARPKGDLPVTRFYAPLHIYQLLRKIHQFDAALRAAFESGSHDKGVYFIYPAKFVGQIDSMFAEQAAVFEDYDGDAG